MIWLLSTPLAPEEPKHCGGNWEENHIESRTVTKLIPNSSCLLVPNRKVDHPAPDPKTHPKGITATLFCFYLCFTMLSLVLLAFVWQADGSFNWLSQKVSKETGSWMGGFITATSWLMQPWDIQDGGRESRRRMELGFNLSCKPRVGEQFYISGCFN